MNGSEIAILQNLLNEQATELLNANVDGIANELTSNPEGKLSVSCSFKLALIGRKLCAAGALGYSRKFTSETEGMVELPDPQQPTLRLGTGDDEADRELAARVVQAAVDKANAKALKSLKEKEAK